MALVVQKYGGTSVGDVDRIRSVCGRIRQTVGAGNQVVVVVSAMGKTTDGLVELSRSLLVDQPATPREMDVLLSTGEQVSMALLSMALQSAGQPAISLRGDQIPILTESHHQRARILHIDPTRIRTALEAGMVVVVAGFQGMSHTTGEMTTLGRGGSDTSAVAIAAALHADRCEIYTDVPGVLTTDPRLIPKAKLLDQITCAEMLELASLGAKVLHPRAVEIARNFGIKLVVRSSWDDHPGTAIVAPPCAVGNLETIEVNRLVDGIQVDNSQAKIALLAVPDRPGIAAQLFSQLANAGIVVDLIVQSIQHPFNHNDIAFTMPRSLLDEALLLCQHCGLQSQGIVAERSITILSITGVGIVGRPGVVSQMFSALASADINIQMISTSETKVSCVIDERDARRGVEALQAVYGVIETPSTCEELETETAQPVRGVALDQKQTRLAVLNVPDRPGVAAELLQRLSHQGISLDMIIQSQSDRGMNHMAFTIATGDRSVAERTLKTVAADLGCGEVLSDDNIAKVSIVGMGMARASGVAAQMFQALSDAAINIEMIATSDIKVSCVIRQSVATEALRAVHQAFQLEGDLIVPIEKG